LGSPGTKNVTHERPFEIVQGVIRCEGTKVAASAAAGMIPAAAATATAAVV